MALESLESATVESITPINPGNLAELFKSDCMSAHKADCGGKGDCGGSGDCEGKADCSEPSTADETTPKERPTFWQRLFAKGLENTIDIAFDEVRKEPTKILMIGGSRQRDFARHIALMLPAADITLIDPSEEETQKAKEEVCCRFKFVTAPIEAMPFERGRFDLVIAHNLPEFCEHWQAAYAEIQRVVTRDQGNMMLSIPNTAAMSLFGWLPGFVKGLSRTGVTLSLRSFELAQLKEAVRATDSAKVGLQISPLPWQWLVVNLQA